MSIAQVLRPCRLPGSAGFQPAPEVGETPALPGNCGMQNQVGISLSGSTILIKRTYMPVTILLVDEYPIVREGLKTVLGGHEDLHVIGETGYGAEAIELAA